MSAVPVKQLVLKAWEATSNGLPRLLIKAYTREEARSEYRSRVGLHTSRPVDLKEITDANGSSKP